jgi:hypothetical protein
MLKIVHYSKKQEASPMHERVLQMLGEKIRKKHSTRFIEGVHPENRG